MKKVSVLFLALMMSAGAYADDALKTVADTANNIFGDKSINVNVAAGAIKDSKVSSKAVATDNSTAAAGGIVASQDKGGAVSVNTALGYIGNSKVSGSAEASGGSQAYAGGIVAGQHQTK